MTPIESDCCHLMEIVELKVSPIGEEQLSIRKSIKFVVIGSSPNFSDSRQSVHSVKTSYGGSVNKDTNVKVAKQQYTRNVTKNC
ncbi:unnamed protein product [Nezara viridula]|uniref:Uncharacterized protein n=1 Tax=Nezara viridula TaxID=85310 RepID=A0A9P0H5B8_NEZVI|nr:unnamed protein product [Nezara viridula]